MHFRIIGIDSLVNLIRVKESADNQETIRKIRTLLTPLEYTRLDELIDVVFTATKDVEESIESAISVNEPETTETSRSNERTSPEEITEIRNRIVSITSDTYGETLIKKTKALYWSPNHEKRLVCTISKRYSAQGIVKYWYAYHPAWHDFLNEGKQSSISLGCADMNAFFLLPYEIIKKVLPNLNTTERKNGAHYWHIKISESQSNKYFLQIPMQEKDIPINEYKINLT